MTIHELFIKYYPKIGHLDLELLIARAIKKPREFVLAHPEFKLNKNQELKTKNSILRRMRGEPIAYIIGHKEFFGLDFKVDKSTLIPRPETEQIVELALNEISNSQFPISKYLIADIGTGSGNIIISIAKAMGNIQYSISNIQFFGVDISSEALKIAKQNAKTHKVNKKIKFLKGNLLEPIFKTKNCKLKTEDLIILANLPYLSKKIYATAPIDVKKYEPRSALLSRNRGLAHYEKLLKQIKQFLLLAVHCSLFIEISPEQKTFLGKLAKKYFPKAEITFFRDLSGKWRICKIKI